jgi:hypothetical protein
VLNTAILITTLLVLVVSVKRLYRTLTLGSMEQLVKRYEDALNKVKEDANKPNQKGVFVFAWFFIVVLLSATTALSVFILTNILNFV